MRYTATDRPTGELVVGELERTNHEFIHSLAWLDIFIGLRVQSVGTYRLFFWYFLGISPSPHSATHSCSVSCLLDILSLPLIDLLLTLLSLACLLFFTWLVLANHTSGWESTELFILAWKISISLGKDQLMGLSITGGNTHLFHALAGLLIYVEWTKSEHSSFTAWTTRVSDPVCSPCFRT